MPTRVIYLGNAAGSESAVPGIRKEVGLLFLVLFLPWKACSQFAHNTVTLSGIVFSTDHNEKVEHARVRLCDGGGNQLQEAVTPQNGEFAFRGLSRGRYLVTIEAIGFVNQQIQVDLSYTSDKGMNIYLQPVQKETHRAAAYTISAHELSMPESARNLMTSGKKKLYSNKDAAGAIADFEQALKVAPGYYEAYRELAMAHATMGKIDEAQKDLRKSIEVSKNAYGDGYVGLGTLLAEKGEVAGGEKALRRGVQLNPNSWQGYFELGKIELGRDKLDDALKSAEMAKTLSPNTPILYRLLANIHLRQKNYPELLDDLDEYIRLDPASAAGQRAAQMREEVAKQITEDGKAASAAEKP